MARICIVTRSALGSNPRVVKEADALADAGHQVHVISVRVLEADSRDDDILTNAGWTVERIDLRARPRRIRLRVQQRLASIVHRLTGQLTATAFDPVSVALARAARQSPADLYIAHYVAALPAAAAAAKKHGAAFAYDAEDFHPGDLPDRPEHARQNGLIRSIEAALLPGCVYTTAASPGIAQAYAEAYGVPEPTVVLNTFPKGRAPLAPSPRGWVEPGPSVYWFSQTIGPDRGLECAVAALALAKTRPHLYLRGDPAPGYDALLVELARFHGVSDRLHLLESGMPSQMESLAAGYDVGLAAEFGCTPNRAIALTNKQFTYMLAGLPVAMSDTPGHQAFARLAPGATQLFKAEDPVSLAAAFDHWLSNPSTLTAGRAEAHRLGQQRFNWEIESANLVQCVATALKRGEP